MKIRKLKKIIGGLTVLLVILLVESVIDDPRLLNSEYAQLVERFIDQISNETDAEPASEGVPEDALRRSSGKIRLCTQNLHNYGLEKYTLKRGRKGQKQLDRQRSVLIKRLANYRCDVIALQEVIAGDLAEAMVVVAELSAALTAESGSKFRAVSGNANDRHAKLGLLFKADLFDLKLTKSYRNFDLDRVFAHDRNRRFSRGPLRTDLVLKSNETRLIAFGFHFKSSSRFGGYDPSGHRFEYDRMRMAQGLKDIMLEASSDFPDAIIVALGDRNSTDDSASARILTGNLELRFFGEHLCKLSKANVPYCPGHIDYGRKFVDLITIEPVPKKGSKTSPRQLIDDILIEANDQHHAAANSLKEDFAVGISELNRDVSDHRLLYTDLSFTNKQ